MKHTEQKNPSWQKVDWLVPGAVGGEGIGKARVTANAGDKNIPEFNSGDHCTIYGCTKAH